MSNKRNEGLHNLYMIKSTGRDGQGMQLVWGRRIGCGIVDAGGDNHVLIFYTVIYCHYAEHSDELQLDDNGLAA
jgi:hypothetical protein